MSSPADPGTGTDVVSGTTVEAGSPNSLAISSPDDFLFAA